MIGLKKKQEITNDTEIERFKGIPEVYTVSYKGNDTVIKTYGPFSTLQAAVSHAEWYLRNDPYINDVRITRVKE